MNNPTQIQKYGDLHFGKISQKLSKCKPALGLLLSSGFEKSNNDTRLIWTDANNNIILLNHIQTELKSMIVNNKAHVPSIQSIQTESLQVCCMTIIKIYISQNKPVLHSNS